MTDDIARRIPPDEVGTATDRLVAAVKALLPEGQEAAADAFGIALGNLLAVTLGRATSLAASAVIGATDSQARQAKTTKRRIDKNTVELNNLRAIVEDHAERLKELELGRERN